MTHKALDRCKETTSTAGLGTLTLTGPAAGCIAMADTVYGLAANGDTSWFIAENGTEWEEFLGTRVSPTQLARTTVIKSSNGGAPVNFTAPPVVYSTVPAEKMSTVGPSFSAYRGTSNQAITSATLTKVQLNAESYDAGDCFDPTTNYRFTPNVAGYYQFSWNVRCDAPAATIVDAAGLLYKNGAVVANSEYVGAACSSYGAAGAALIYMNGTTDFVELWAYITGTTPRVVFGADKTYLSGCLAALPGAPMLAPVVSPGPAASAYRATSTQALSSGVWTKVQLTGELFDTAGAFDSTTNFRFQPNVEGYYDCAFGVYFTAASALTQACAGLYKNGSIVAQGSYNAAANTTNCASASSKLVYMNGTSDYLELFGYGSGTSLAIASGEHATYLTCKLAALPTVATQTVDKVMVQKTGASNSPAATWGKTPLDTVMYDTNGLWDAVNTRVAPKKPGYYQVNARTRTNTAGNITCAVYNTTTANLRPLGSESTLQAAGGSCILYCNGINDYIELYSWTSASRAYTTGNDVFLEVIGPISTGTEIRGGNLSTAVNLTRNTAQAAIASNNSTDTFIDWTSQSGAAGFWTAGVPSRITIPAGFTQVRLSYTVNWPTSAVGARVSLIYKNGVAIFPGGQIVPGLASLPNITSGQTGWLDCTTGDYYQLGIRQSSGGNLTPDYQGLLFSAEFR